MNTNTITGTAIIIGDVIITGIIIIGTTIIMGAAIDLDRPLIYLCRHGETEWTLTGRHTSFSEISLTENGRMQAAVTGKRLRHVHFQKIIVSPMIRARETLDLAKLGQEKTIDPNAMEWNYGQYEGLTTNEIFEKNPTWNVFNDGAPGGESPDDVQARADALLKSLKKESGAAAIFSHAHFLRTLAARWLDLPVAAGQFFYLDVASVSILGFEHGRHVIQRWNDTGHL